MKNVFVLMIVLSILGLAVYGVCHCASVAYHWVADGDVKQGVEKVVEKAGEKLDKAASATAPCKTSIPKWIENHGG